MLSTWYQRQLCDYIQHQWCRNTGQLNLKNLNEDRIAVADLLHKALLIIMVSQTSPRYWKYSIVRIYTSTPCTPHICHLYVCAIRNWHIFWNNSISMSKVWIIHLTLGLMYFGVIQAFLSTVIFMWGIYSAPFHTSAIAILGNGMWHQRREESIDIAEPFMIAIPCIHSTFLIQMYLVCLTIMFLRFKS